MKSYLHVDKLLLPLTKCENFSLWQHLVAGVYHCFNVVQVNPPSFFSLVLLAWYMESTVVVRDAFKPIKGHEYLTKGLPFDVCT